MKKEEIQTTMTTLINDVRIIVERGLKKAYQNVNAISKDYSRGFYARDLRNYRQLYLCFNDLEIWYSRVPNLNWSHYCTLLSVTNNDYFCNRKKI